MDHFDELTATGGDVGAELRRVDWAATPLGDPAGWPQSLCSTVRAVLGSRFSMWMGWGPDLTFFYNDAYARDTLDTKHPWALGRPAREVWAEIWDDIGPRIEHVLSTGTATWDEGLLLFLERSGYREETYHTFSYSPLADDAGRVVGMLCVVAEETQRVIAQRRMATLHDLARELRPAETEGDVFAAVGRCLDRNRSDLPFTLAFLRDPEAAPGGARPVAASGVPGGHAEAIDVLAAATGDEPPLAELLAARGPEVLEVAPHGADGPAGAAIPTGDWDVPPQRLLAVPLAEPGSSRPAGTLIAAAAPYRPLDAAYRGFIGLVADQVASSLASVRAREAERRRAAALAELDRAKTAFFQNVSHELRTPLTLILGPLAQLAERAELNAEAAHEVALARGNAQRLLKLVNSLLDFSRLEAGHLRGAFRPVDLAAVTTQLASMFRSAIDDAGLGFEVDCAPLPEPVYADVAMWETIVLNLLSNALKFTLDGSVGVRLRAEQGGARLEVSDTGEGIPAAELDRLFTRFHRVRGARSRTHEGTGIGLAMVDELARLHGGSAEIASEPGVGTTVTVRLPFGSSHLATEDVLDEPAGAPAVGARVPLFTDEALAWGRDRVPVAGDGAAAGGGADAPAPGGARILVVDDNADMRAYLVGLLRPHHACEAVPDGAAALAAIGERRPDLVLTDAMMPQLDGFELLRALRADRRTRTVPVIMLSARAGPESAVQGLAAGADDYLVKPFSSSELLARVQANLELARRREDDLRRREEESLRFFDLSPELMGAAGFDGYLKRANQAFGRLLGWSEAELLERPYMELIHPGDHARIQAAVAQLAGGGEVRDVEARLLLKDGGHRSFMLSARAVLDEGTMYFVAGDITERRSAEERHRLLAEILEATSDFVGMAEPGGRTLWVNEAGRRMTGRGRDGDDGGSGALADFVAPEGLERFAQQSLPAAMRHGIWRGETPLRGPGGSVVPTSQVLLAHRGRTGDVELVSTIARDVKREKQAEALVALNVAILERVAAREPLEAILQALALGVEAQAGGMLASVLLLDEDGARLRHAAAPSLPAAYSAAIDGVRIGPSVGSCGTAAHRREAVVVEDIAADPLWADFRELAVGHGLRACWSTPIASGTGELLGTFALYYREPRAPDAEHLMLIEVATHLARTAIEHERAEREHVIAQTLQRSLLPDRLPEVPGVQLAVRYLPGAEGMEVGGDWYDVFRLPGGRIGVALGDVVGRGLKAAVRMGELRTALRAVARSAGSAVEVFGRLAELVEGDTYLATLVYGSIDPGTGMLRFASAGHPPPVVRAPDGGAAFLEGGRCPPVGVVHGSGTDAVAQLAPGSTLVLYTDGLVERRGRPIDAGLEELRRVVAAHDGDPEALCDELLRHFGAERAGDDVAVLAVKLEDAPARALRLRLAGSPSELAALRNALRRWLGEHGAGAEEADDVVLAVSEAVANAITHAYPLGDGAVEVAATAAAGTLDVVVSDSGRWRPPRADGGGRGIALMRAVMDEVDVSSDEHGTTARLRRRLGAPPREAAAAAGPPAAHGPDGQDGVGPDASGPFEVVAVAGEIDHANAGELGERLERALSGDEHGLVVDLRDCRYLDSAGLRVLFDASRRLRVRRRELRLVVPDGSPLLRLLALTGLDREAARFPDVPAATYGPVPGPAG